MRHLPLQVLVVEDSADDADLFQMAVRKSEAPAEISIAENGEEALQYLKTSGAERKNPDVVLLDLNLPRMNGTELLSAIKNDPGLRVIPVIVFTVSNSDDDVGRCYLLGCSCYLIKPDSFERLIELTRKIFSFLTEVEFARGPFNAATS